jgi:protein SCO1/2
MSKENSKPYGTLLLFLFWLLLLAVVFYWMLPGKTNPPELQGVLRPVPKPLHEFSLIDQHRQAFRLERLKGKWSFIFFGYTHCPDVCPTTLSTLAMVSKKLQADPNASGNFQVVFVTVDPQRDTPGLIGKYLDYFNQDFLGASGTKQDLDSLTRQFGAGYMLQPKTGTDEYLISHTSSIFLVDPQARIVAAFSPPHDPGTIAEQFQQIRTFFSK